MAVTTEISWGDGTSDKIYLTRNASEGNQTVLVSSDANTGAARSKVVTFSASGASPVTLTVSQEAASLPYDAEVEYLASAGTGAYIDSGIECTGGLSVVVRAYWTTNENKSFLGGIKANGGNSYFRHHLSPYYTGQGYSLYWYQNGTSGTPTVSGGMSPAVNKWSIVSVNADTGEWYFEQGTSSRTGSMTPLSDTITTGRNFGIFARINADGTLQSRPVRISLVRLSKGGVKLREFIPVRKGNVGYLYDKVSGQLFGNAGTGSFTYGNDVV